MNDTFLNFVNTNNIDSYDKFCICIEALESMKKGKYFEYLCKLFFILDADYSVKYRNFMMFSEIPKELKNTIGIPPKDKGIDAIVYDNNNNLYSIQCKYIADKKYRLSFKQLATFLGLTYGANAVFSRGIIFTNYTNVCCEIKNDKYMCILHDEIRDRCDSEFWENAINYMNQLAMMQESDKLLSGNFKAHYETNNKGRIQVKGIKEKNILCSHLANNHLCGNKLLYVVSELDDLRDTLNVYNRKRYDIIIITDTDDCNDIILRKIKGSDKIIVVITYDLFEHIIYVNCAFDFVVFDDTHANAEFIECYHALMCGDLVIKKLVVITLKGMCYDDGVNNIIEDEMNYMTKKLSDFNQISEDEYVERSGKTKITENELMEMRRYECENILNVELNETDTMLDLEGKIRTINKASLLLDICKLSHDNVETQRVIIVRELLAILGVSNKDLLGKGKIISIKDINLVHKQIASRISGNEMLCGMGSVTKNDTRTTTINHLRKIFDNYGVDVIYDRKNTSVNYKRNKEPYYVVKLYNYIQKIMNKIKSQDNQEVQFK